MKVHSLINMLKNVR